jgi:hypothetical protein
MGYEASSRSRVQILENRIKQRNNTYDNDCDRNQIVNFTYLDYATNIYISDASPADYVGRYRTKLGEDGYRLACAQNALPENFESLEYPDFVAQRRMLMSRIVRKAYNELSK